MSFPYETRSVPPRFCASAVPAAARSKLVARASVVPMRRALDRMMTPLRAELVALYKRFRLSTTAR